MLTRITVESMTITKQKISLYFVQYLLKSIENILNHLINLPTYVQQNETLVNVNQVNHFQLVTLLTNVLKITIASQVYGTTDTWPIQHQRSTVCLRSFFNPGLFLFSFYNSVKNMLVIQVSKTKKHSYCARLGFTSGATV